jgi:hypothetical protein
MLNDIRTEPEIFASKVDHSAGKSDIQFLQIFNFEGKYLKTGRQQGISCCGFFLVGVLTIELKTRKPNLKNSHFGISATLFPTVHLLLWMNFFTFRNHWEFFEYF